MYPADVMKTLAQVWVSLKKAFFCLSMKQHALTMMQDLIWIRPGPADSALRRHRRPRLIVWNPAGAYQAIDPADGARQLVKWRVDNVALGPTRRCASIQHFSARKGDRS